MTARLFRPVLVTLLVANLMIGAPLYGQQQDQSPGQAPSSSSSQNVPLQAVVNPPGSGQTDDSFTLTTQPRYDKGQRWFPEVWLPYTQIHIKHTEFLNSPRLDQLISDGKLRLSLEDAVSLALENNLDISVQRFVPWIADTDELRSESGGVPRGANGTGSAATTLGSIPAAFFDPVLSSTVSISDQVIPISNPFLAGTGTTSLTSIQDHTNDYNFSYSQAFHTGTSISVTWDNTRASTNSPGQIFNPYVLSTVTYEVQQQLLNGFGLLPNIRYILESKNEKKVADLTFALQVIATVTQVKNYYWELVYARENVKVVEAALKTSTKLYEDNQKQVKIGTLAPIEVVRAESEMATDDQNLIVAQTTALQQQTLLLNAITKNPLAPNLLNIEIIPTDTIPEPATEDVPDIQSAVNEAWQKRPELQQAQYNLKNADIEIKATRNALLPTATAFAQYSGSGLGGNLIESTTEPTSFIPDIDSPLVGASGVPILINGLPVYSGLVSTANVLNTVTPGGLNDALYQVGENHFPTYAVGLNFSLPIRNRSAQADSARALLNERQMETSYHQTQNSIFVAVRNALIALQQDRVQVTAAGKARYLAQETLDAEQKKYQLGASTPFLVIQAQRDLTTAQGTELRARINLVEAQVNYEQAIGRTLDANHITVADAKDAHFYRDTLIPGTPVKAAYSGN
jgi:outer membrane protein